MSQLKSLSRSRTGETPMPQGVVHSFLWHGRLAPCSDALAAEVTPHSDTGFQLVLGAWRRKAPNPPTPICEICVITVSMSTFLRFVITLSLSEPGRKLRGECCSLPLCPLHYARACP